MAINLQAKQLELSQLIAWLAAVIYPDDEPSASKKRVRQRIREGAKKQEITISPTDGKEYLETKKFFYWAVTQWSELIDVEGIPKEPVSGSCTMTLPSLKCEAFGVNIPNDINELREAYCKAESERQRLQLENDKLRSTIAELDEELQQRREKADRISRQNSKSGKKGGRGNSY
ncbi:MAG: hypothetical protein OQL08_04530 [Gammaproteobacteria bacterium]|nr:hypothetical protein [Gammaproteobacteria bacterium]